MTLISRLSVLAAKVETTPGTAETLTNAEAAYNIFDAQIQPGINMTQRNRQGSFGVLQSVPEQYMGTCTFRLDLVGNGAGGVPSWATVFLSACGLVNSAGTLTPRNEGPGTNVKTITIGLYENGRRKLLSGCSGNASFVFVSGQIIAINFTFSGKWNAVTDETILTPTYPATLGMRAGNSTFTVGSFTPCFQTMTIDLGNNVVPRPCAAQVSGIASFIITDRIPTITMDAEAKTVTADGRYTRWLASTPQAFSYAIADTTDLITFAAPAVQIQNIQDGDRDGLRIDNIALNCTGSEPLTIAFASA